MKTLRYFAFAAAILAAACAKEEPAPEQHSVKEITFTADNGGNYTKTQLVENENGAAVEWCGGDKISVFDGASANREFTTENGGATATFSGKATEVAEGGYWYAVYPYAAANSISGTTITTTLPDVQEVASNAVADGVNVTAAKSATTAFSFKNLCGLIRVEVPADFAELKSITINSDKAIAGEFTVDCSGEAPVFGAAGAEAVKSVTLSKKDGSVLTAGNWYVAAFPGTHNICISLTDNNGKTVILGGNVNVKVQASKITGVGEVDTDVFTHSTVLVKAGDDLQAAINAANAGDRLLLAAGTYTGNFTLKDGVNISGGWNATYTVCDPKTYKTVLDGNKTGITLNQSSNFNNPTNISGLTIQNGYSTGDGGGILIRKNTTVRNCIMTDNTAGKGAGLYIREEGKAYDCIIKNNTATDKSGGVQIHKLGTLENCIVTNNTAANDGGGILLSTGGNIHNCLVINNTCNGNGASGIRVQENAANRVINTTIANNHNTTSNTATYAVYYDTNGRLVNSIIYGNTVANVDNPQQVYINHKYPYLWNNAVTINGIKFHAEYDTLRNCDTVNIETDIFNDSANNDFTLKSNAVCIDKGAETSVSAYNDKFTDEKNIISNFTTDLAGNTRSVDTIDIGCYEYQK